MANSTSRSIRGRLFTTTLLAGIAVFGASHAFAQASASPIGGSTNGSAAGTTAGQPANAANTGQVSSGGLASSGQPDPNASTGADAASVQEVVVTGSLIRHKLSDTAAPVTQVTAADLDQRGITTVQEAIQTLASNGSGALPNNFTGNGAFASGASGASLRGLTTNSTLTLIDGMRAAYYPLADDGVRNFVDLNTIPDVIVDRIEVLKDGASAIYGADAIAGVINVITKKTYEGITVKAEAGASQQGGGDENNFQALVGYGNLARDGYNVYLGLEYEHDDPLYSRERGYPYNTGNQSQTCGVSIVTGGRTCRTNSVVNGLQFDGTFAGVGTDIVPVVRPYNATNTTAAGNYQLLNQAAGCGGLNSVSIGPAQIPLTAAGTPSIGGFTTPVTLCQQNFRHDYDQISPNDKRFSATFRATKDLGGDGQAWVEANYYQNEAFSRNTPSAIRFVTPPAATGLTYSTATLALPVYVCPQGSATFTCNAGSAGATLNPNNPFANNNQVARIFYSFGDIPSYNEDFSQTYRIAAGLTGKFNAFGEWHYDVEGVAMQSDLRATSVGFLYLNNLLTAVNQGTYNFANPSANTAAIRNFVSPTNVQDSTSREFQIQATLTRTLFQLPGGPMQLAILGSARYEAIYNPSANPDDNGIYDRFAVINPFGTIGSRNTEAGGFDLDVPVLKQIDIELAGRYDTYSTGQDNFSPSVTGKIKPFADWAPQFDKITLRSTYSQGFRIPSFAEANSLPTTGYITTNAAQSCQAAHGGVGSSNAVSYCNGYSLGLTTEGTAGLKPEYSSNFTAGLVFDPIRQLSFSVDYFRISKRDVIASADYTPALAAYYSGGVIPAGYQVIPDVADPNFPNALPRAGFVVSGFANLNQQTVSGYDIGATARATLPFGIKYTSTFDGEYILKFNTVFPDGSIQHYAGSIGPYQTTSASGTLKFKASWLHTLAYGPVTVSATAYFYDGYQEEPEDNGAVIGDCYGSAANTGTPTTFRDGVTPVSCKVKPFWDVDMHGTYDINKHLQLYLDISNLFNKAAPYDPTTYGGDDYNPAWASDGILGRYFKIGARATF